MNGSGTKKREPVARLYAKALFELAHEKGELDVVLRDLGSLVEIVQSSPQLIQAVSAFMFPVESRQKLALEVMQKAELSPSILRFVQLLIVKNRFQVIEQIYDAFRALVDQSKNTVRGTLTTVDILSDAETAEISQAFARKFSKQVVLEPVIDKSLIGGLVVQVQGLTFDGSLKTTIRRLRETLERQSI